MCDGEGNVFFVVVPKADPRDLKRSAALARYTKVPCDILRVSADGEKTTLIQPAAIPAFANASTVKTLTLALDPSGSLHALVVVLRAESDKEYKYTSGKQFIVSFDSKYQYSSHLEVDQDEMVVRRFEALGAGDFFVDGMRPGDGPRVAVMGAGGSLTDMAVLEGDENETPPPSVENKNQTPSPVASLGLLACMARGGDGQVYFVPQGEESVHVIGASGASRLAFRLARMQRGSRLIGLRAAGNRLVAAYYEERPEHTAWFWMAVYDAVLGERLAVYGPANAIPICYRYADGQDQFTLLRGTTLVTMSP